jgi:hypothetical protein
MDCYEVLFHGGTPVRVEVSPDGVIVSATPALKQAVGLRFKKFSAWAKGRGGEVYRVRERTAKAWCRHGQEASV